jgi:hypothetical protein
MIGWFGSTCFAVDLSHGLLIVLVASDLDHEVSARFVRETRSMHVVHFCKGKVTLETPRGRSSTMVISELKPCLESMGRSLVVR